MQMRPLLRDVAGSLLFGLGVTTPARAAAGRLVIVTFHRVLPRAQAAQYPIRPIAVEVDELAWFLGFFREHFTCLPLREAVAAHQAGEAPARPLLAVTFDDGQRDNFEHARPVLAAHGVRATFFAVAEAAARGDLLWHDRAAYALQAALAARTAAPFLDELGLPPALTGSDLLLQALERLKRRTAGGLADWLARLEAAAGGPASPPWDGMMTFEQLRALASDGHEIGSHSLSHAILTSTAEAALREETERSKSWLEAELGAPVVSFCYPNGDHDGRVVEAVRRAGYACAVTVRWGTNVRATPPHELRRCDLQGATSRAAGGALSKARLAWRLSGRHPGLA